MVPIFFGIITEPRQGLLMTSGQSRSLLRLMPCPCNVIFSISLVSI
ncbi:hypothetical protein GEI7407_3344 [Geitlerinema sp. PCC 7407]|nr:hypothetical protein GEI7407_3344 [Geitlerinema sp. PCC 7407]